MNPPLNEREPFPATHEPTSTDWDLCVDGWISNSEPPKLPQPGESLGDFSLDNELKTFVSLRDSVDLTEEDREGQLQSCRARILKYAENSASVEEKGIIAIKFLESLDAPHGFHDFEDLISARQVVSYGVDWLIVEAFVKNIERHVTMDSGWPLILARLKVASDPEVIRNIVYKELSPRFDWGKAK